MKPIRSEMVIEAPVDTTFRQCADIANAAQRCSQIKHVEIVSGQQIGVGTRWKETREMFGREATEELWISAFEPNQRYTIEAESCGAHYQTEFRFTPLDDQRTQVQVEFTVQARSLMAKVMSPLSRLMASSLEQAIRQDLADLKQAIESTAS